MTDTLSPPRETAAPARHASAGLDRFLRAIAQRYRQAPRDGEHPPFAVRYRGDSYALGAGPPAFALVVNSPRAAAALNRMDALGIGESYLAGELDVEGDLGRAIRLRALFKDRHPLQYLWRFLKPLLMGQVRADKASIAVHYDEDPDFYLLFLDQRHRCYSQGIFERDDEPVEDAVARKLQFALDAVGARPGDHVLDIGAGWGCFTEYAGRQGVRVTSLTISRASQQYVNALIEREKLPCRVVLEHLLEHAPTEKYDAIVNLGVSEHLPKYRAVVRKYLDLLKPGATIYLDASATRVKHNQPAFTARYIFPGNGSLLCLHEYLAEVARTPFQLRGIHDDRHNYYLTAKHWAENFDRNREKVEARWGTQLYRKFRIFLWANADSLRRDTAQAYRIILRKP